jgi:hypothetical protein
MKMGTMVVLKTDGTEEHIESKKLDLHKMYELIPCTTVERIKVRYEGKVRDCYLDEEGLYTQKHANHGVKRLAELYYGAPCQTFMGNAVIWIPGESDKIKKEKKDKEEKDKVK